MAKAPVKSSNASFLKKDKAKRKGKFSKKQSTNKTSKHYKKPYRSQGR